MWIQDSDDDMGLPDAALTQDELDAGVQHIMRSGYAGSPGPRSSIENRGALFTPQFNTLHFPTYELAQAWAKANPGNAFSRAANGFGFEAKLTGLSPAPVVCVENSSSHDELAYGNRQRLCEDRIKRSDELRELSPHAYKSFECWSNCYSHSFPHLFSRNVFMTEIQDLSKDQRNRLRVLLAQEFLDNQRSVGARPGDSAYRGRTVREVNTRVGHALAILDEYMNTIYPTAQLK